MKIYLILLFILVNAVQAVAQDELKIGGHIRLNADYRDWVDDSDRTRFEFESLKLSFNGKTGPFTVSADYRYYENVDFNAIRFADFGYQLDENWSFKLGITRVPFGKQAFLSNSFWYSINYYLGFEDDNDAGFVANYQGNNWQLSGGYFFNDEFNKPASFDRYSFDVADDGELRNKENGQWNLHYQGNWPHASGASTSFSLSYQRADILDLNTLHNNSHKAFSSHIQHSVNQFDIALQYIDYEYEVSPMSGANRDAIALSAFGYPFQIAKEGQSLVANIAYTFKNINPRVRSVTCYSEYGLVDSDLSRGRKSIQWVNGCMAAVDKFYIYLDAIHGENMWFAGGSGIGLDFNDGQPTTHRTNLSIGYYF